MENILENNRLIAEFLGQKSDKYEFPQFGYMNTKGDFITEFNDSQLKFHKDWNWLMEAVEKIESKGFDIFINTCVCRIVDVGEDRFEDIECFVNNNKKQAVYKAVVEFIKWYNNQN